MNVKFLLQTLLFFLPFLPDTTAQVIDSSAQWTWMHGDNTNLDRGIATTTGVPTPTIRPSSRWQSCGWTGNDGRLWVFGGEYNNGNHGSGIFGNTLNDLWRYDIPSGQWTLVGGIFSFNTNAGFNVGGTYGTIKIASAANWPGSRRGATSWKDAAGNFWMFGGWGGTAPLVRGYFNDLWKYDVASGQWTWVSGDNGFTAAGTYGTKGIASALNKPGGRGGYAYHGGNHVSWTDAAGNFWIFGGYGYDAAGNLGALNDLWKYDPAADMWTWISGSNQSNQPGVYGTRGVAAAANIPGGRYSPFNWQDASGKFWLFGGFAFDASGTLVRLGDLWMYDPATNLWTWMNGSDQPNQPGVYGNRGQAAAVNQPGARFSSAQNSAWVDVLGKFWMYGGSGYGVSGLNAVHLSDLWQYDPATNLWTWMKGPDPATAPHLANRGTQGVRAPANYPAGKYGSLCWKDLTGNFWMLGGITYTIVSGYTERATSDLWRLDQVIVIPPKPVYTKAPPDVCLGDSLITYSVNPVPTAITYEWIYTGTGVVLRGGATTTLPENELDFTTNATSGVLRVRAVNAHGAGPYADTFISVHPVPVVDLGPDIDTCGLKTYLLQSGISYGSAVYAWSTGESTPQISARDSNRYWLEVTQNGCTGKDTINVNLVNLVVDLGPDLSLCDRDAPVTLGSSQPYGAHYLWSNGLSDTTMSVSRTNRYWLEITYKGCRLSDTVFVDVVPSPDVNLGPDSIICEQFPLRIGFEVPGASYQWSSGQTTPFIMAAGTASYVLDVTIGGCTVSDTISLTALPVPDINLGEDRDICEDGTIILSSTVSGSNEYLWNTGQADASITVTEAGTYWVRVVTEHQCVGNDTVTLTYFPNPRVFLIADTVVCEENPLVLDPVRLNTESLLWSDGSNGNTLSVRSGGAYIVNAINKCGTAADTILVREIFCDIWVPDAFTPNNDGKNDAFRILGNTGRLEAFSMSIYNRWGERVFHTADKTRGWDGRHAGREALLGTYTFVLEYDIAGNHHIEKGTIELIK